jgi:hypothetical protein
VLRVVRGFFRKKKVGSFESIPRRMDKYNALSLTLIGGAFLMLAVGLLAMFSGATNLFMVSAIAMLVGSIFLGARAVSGETGLYSWQAITGILGVVILTIAAVVR